MGLLAFARDGRVIATGLGVSVVVLVATLRLVLESIRDQNEIKPPELKTQYITQETEDSLKLSTLESLLGHYNYAIRETSAKIICDRALNDPDTLKRLLWGITRPDYDERMRNLRTLAMITDQHSLYFLNTPMAHAALVRSLELSLGIAPPQKLNDPYHDDYHLRDMSEKFCLMFIIQLLSKFDPEKLIKAGFVEKWLVKQDWGDTEAERQQNFALYVGRRHNRISEICHWLHDTRGGREALERAGLLPPGSSADADLELEADEGSEDRDRINLILSIRMARNSIDEAGEIRTIEAFTPRVLEQSLEEQRLRRQHREAMVLNDGTRPLGRGDIIERGRD